MYTDIDRSFYIFLDRKLSKNSLFPRWLLELNIAKTKNIS